MKRIALIFISLYEKSVISYWLLVIRKKIIAKLGSYFSLFFVPVSGMGINMKNPLLVIGY